MFDIFSHTISINTDIFKKIYNIDIFDRVIIEHHNDFLTLKDLLFNAKELSKFEQASLNKKYAIQKICDEIINS